MDFCGFLCRTEVFSASSCSIDFIVVGLIDLGGSHPCVSGDLCIQGRVDLVLLMKLCQTEIHLELQLFFIGLILYELSINVEQRG